MEIYSSNSFESMGLNYVTVSILFHAQAKIFPKFLKTLLQSDIWYKKQSHNPLFLIFLTKTTN